MSRSTTRLLAALTFLGSGLFAVAATLDYFGPPPAGDPSAWTGPIVSESLADDLSNQPPVYKGAIEGGPTGTAADQGATGLIAEDELDGGGKYNIPTDSKPSPLFGAQPYTQQMLRFEEFGTRPLDPTLTSAMSFPRPTVGPLPGLDPFDPAKSGPDASALDAFLSEPGISPFPREFSNTDAENPWKPDIERFLGRALDTPPAEGRPPGQGWAHQRWNEFYPVEFFKTAQTGARVNSGFRDANQRHGYAVGEWGPGGLYHNTTGAAGFDGSTAGIGIRFHPAMPVQDHRSIWTFDGTLPPKLLKVRVGQPLLMRHYNALPIDVTANRGFGMHTISTHEHNGHSPAESDGFAGAFYFPGQFYDYRACRLRQHQHRSNRSARRFSVRAGRDAVRQRCQSRSEILRKRFHQYSWRLAADDEHALVPRSHARFHGAQCIQGQRGNDELLQRTRPRSRVA